MPSTLPAFFAASSMTLAPSPVMVSGWLVLIAFLMISNVPTLSWGRMRPRRTIRLEVLAIAGLVVAGLIAEPWLTLIGICIVYLALLPVGFVAYARFRRRAVLAGQGRTAG